MLASRKYQDVLERINEWYVDPKKIVEASKKYEDVIKKSKFVYFLIYRNEIVYVGLSDTLQRRLHQHTKDKIFDKVHWIRVEAKDQKYIEAYYIKTLNPKYNKFCPVR